jgi:hypothetical protein
LSIREIRAQVKCEAIREQKGKAHADER